jgi:hypothetical protein
MPSKYDREAVLPLRVPRELRARLDAVRALAPELLRLPRNSVAIGALARGLDTLAAELASDPTAVHRALAGSTSTAPARASTPSTGSSSGTLARGRERAPSVPAARTVPARSTTRARSERGPSKARARTGNAPSTTRARTEHAPPAGPVDGEALDAAAVLVRFLAAGVKVAPFAKAHGVARSTLQMWATGKRPLPAAALALVVKGLDVEGK